ncbi:MAG: hypothetical protein NXH97_21035 [Rhodobacteraceae bacterium]|nr:hypothetical protein [Paracoccaceae bacterium]
MWSTYTGVRGGIAAILAGFLAAVPTQAEDLSAGVVLTKMDANERYTYVAGIIEGLAYARFVSDGREEQPGMACIYGWFYEEDGAVDQIWAAFERFPDHLPGAVTAALIERRCGG